MKHTRILFGSMVLLVLISACSTDWRNPYLQGPPGQEITGADWYGDSAAKVVWLDQGWRRGDSNWFYNTTQGSQLLPYPFFLALEQAGGTEPFRSVRNMQKYRYLPEYPNPRNRDGLPVGFVADRGSPLPARLVSDQRSLGLTCAACHTTQINYRGTAMRIDGGPAMADFESFMRDLTAALQAAAKDDAKFGRFAGKVLRPTASEADKTELRAELRKIADRRAAYDRVNAPGTPYGFARLDAFGRIFNNALTLVDPHNGVKANAPVSYPHLWGAPREQFVQWTGIASNEGIGPVTRNVGEVVGVFAAIDPGAPVKVGYESSVHVANLLDLEDRLKRLRTPRWPEDILPKIDQAAAARGKQIYAREGCSGCHALRGDQSRTALTKSVPISELETDPLTARNIINDRGRTGYLKGTRQEVVAGDRYGDAAPAFDIVGNTVLRTFAGKLSVFNTLDANDPLVEQDAVFLKQLLARKPLFSLNAPIPALQYKARPLDGIWATAPYLHNGSVPNLYEMLLPPEKRSKSFAVGRREFDPQRVGFRTEPTAGAFVFDTTKPGNSNAGHSYAAALTEPDRLALLEYLKSI